MLESEQSWNGTDDGKNFHRVNCVCFVLFCCFRMMMMMMISWMKVVQFANLVQIYSCLGRLSREYVENVGFNCFIFIMVHLVKCKLSQVMMQCWRSCWTACSLLLCSAGVRYQITTGLLSGAA